MVQLTIIISFKNEKNEVKNTLDNIIETLDQDVYIILINDGSDDSYDYKSDIIGFSNVTYIENKESLGIANCRNLGVSRIITPFFLLLDAHMRFYSKGWVSSIISVLSSDSRCLICCQTLPLQNVCGQIVEVDRGEVYGAFLYPQSNAENFLDIDWSCTEGKLIENNLMEIPCVLGAAYACSRHYWEKLRGLEGLVEYGLDEQFISLKVWIEGGRCILLKNIIVGHIYREYAPYVINSSKMLFNKLLIIELLFPFSMKMEYFKLIQKLHPENFLSAIKRLCELEDWIDAQKVYFKSIFQSSIDAFFEKK